PGNGSHPSMRTVPPPRGATLAPPTRGSRWWPALGATAALAASGVGLWILTSSPVPPSSGGAVTAPSNSTHAHDSRNAATSSAATPAATITVSVATTPTNATILLDGEATTNPLRIHVPRDDQQHHVEVRAAGFETFAVTTDFSNDVQLQVALDEEKQGPHSTAPPPPSPALPRSATRRSPPAVAPSASAAPSPPSVAPAPPHATSALEPAPKRTRQLDANNPYK
ncbi:MAG TPA: PEGA domain-containing protein, partial [Sorangium sp.]|nr:PEGA domain-containing protein [Sorangium sp.]